MKNKPILFLNIDGVLTNARTYVCARHKGGGPRDALDAGAIALIAELCDQVDLDVVICSVWGRFYPTAEDWRTLFESFGAQISVVGVLSADSYIHDAQSAIAAMVAERANPAYVILDDEPIYAAGVPAVHVNRMTGVTVRDVARVLRVITPNGAFLHELEQMGAEFGDMG